MTVSFIDGFDRTTGLNPAPGDRTYQLPVGAAWATSSGYVAEGTGPAVIQADVADADAQVTLATDSPDPAGLVLWYADPGNYVTVGAVPAGTGATITVSAVIDGDTLELTSAPATAPKTGIVLAATLAGGLLRVRHGAQTVLEGYDLAAALTAAGGEAGTAYGFFAEGTDQWVDAFRLDYDNPLHEPTVITLAPAAAPGALVLDMAPALRSPIAYGPRVETATPPPPLAVTLYHPGDLTAPVAELTLARQRHWIDQLNEPGSASVVLQNDDPALELVADGDVLRFELAGHAAFAALVRQRDQVTIAPAGPAALTTTLSGPGTLARLDTALVYPPRGPGALPVTEDRPFNWIAVDYDDTAWGPTAAVTSLVAAQAEGGWPQTFGEGFPAVGGIDVIWAPGGTVEVAPEGHCYFRRTFTSDAGWVLVYAVIDNRGEVYLDGQLVKEVSGFSPVSVSGVLPVSAGPHTLAVHAVNGPGPGGSDPIYIGPGGVALAVYAADPSGNPSNVIAFSEPSWKCLAYPPAPPGMTPGEVLRHCVTEAQGRGALPGLTLAFTDETDSDGVPWPETGDIATKVGTDLLTFARELTATYIDVWMEPAGWRLWAWVKDGRGEPLEVPLHGPTDPTDPFSGNLTTLTHRRAP